MIKPKHYQQKRRVLVAIYDQCQVLDVSGPVEALTKANFALEKADAGPLYDISLVAAATGKVKTSAMIELYVDQTYGDINEQDLAALDTLIIVGGNGIYKALDDENLRSLILAAAKKARRIVAVCSGAFMLADLGLLDHRRATTHWDCAFGFETRYPDVRLEIDSIYVRDGQFWTSAGITAGIDMTLALIEEDHGSQIALRVARQLVVYMMRSAGQAQFSAQLKLQQVDDNQLRQLIDWIDDNPQDDLSVVGLALRCAMSERNFNRRFTRQTGITPARYVEMSRLEAARRKLEQSDLSLQSISETCGFNSIEIMRRLFQRKLGLSPGKYRQRFRSSLQHNLG